MDKRQAQTQIKAVLQKPFDRENFNNFVGNLLNDIEVRDNHYRGGSIWEAYREHIAQYWRIGKYTDPNGEPLDILIVETKSLAKLDQARTSLRNFVVRHLKQFEKEVALVAFYAKEDHGADWRFSFVKVEQEAKSNDQGKVTLKSVLSPAKRYSYLVGQHEHSYTAQKQLLPLLERDYANPTIAELEAAFSVEKVTDEFFEQYKELYLKLSEQVSRAPTLPAILHRANVETNRFTKKLLGQIVFLYFVQKKGWLGVPSNAAWGKGNRRFLRDLFTQAADSDKNFYAESLQYLFYEVLAQKRTDSDYPRFGCKIPFLNGGLFEADYDWRNERLILPNELFSNHERNKAGDEGSGILDVFDRYNFTIKEDEPLEKEVAVDPEMLGKVFENMLETVERKSKGAFYTPREIVHYMCQESLIHYLDNALNGDAATFREFGSPQISLFGNEAQSGQLVFSETEPSVRVPKQDLEELIRNGHLRLENDQRVLDKGKETDTYEFQLPEAVRTHAALLDEKLRMIKICDPAIGSGAFPVGLLHEIVNARLVLQAFTGKNESPYALKRHAILESIYGVDIDPSAIDIARLRLWLSLIVDEDNFASIDALPNLDYKIVQGNSLIGFPDNWSSPGLQEIEKLQRQFSTETEHAEKQRLKAEIDGKISQRLANSQRAFGYQVDFDFKLWFSEVWQERSGFDVVIGNPPYKIIYDISDKEILEYLYDSFKRNNDIYVAFFQKGVLILNTFGILSLITPNTYLNGDYFKTLRVFLTQNTVPSHIVDFKSHKVFADPTVFVSIAILNSNLNQIGSRYSTYEGDISSLNFSVLNISRGSDKPFIPENPIIENLNANIPLTFNAVFHIKDVGFNYWSKGKGKDRSGNSIGKQVLYSGNKQNPKDIPFIKGRNISKYHVSAPVNYLRYNYENYLEPGIDTFRFSAKFLMQLPKIIYRQTSDKIIAAIDYNGHYCDKTVHLIVAKDEFRHLDYAYVVSLLNSKLFNYLYLYLSQEEAGRAFSQVKTTYIKKLPFIPYSGPPIFSTIVSWIETLLLITSSSKLHLAFFEELLNGLVYEVFYASEIKAANKELLAHLGNLTPISDEMSEEAKLAIIQTEFERLYDPRHPVRNHLETLDSVYS